MSGGIMLKPQGSQPAYQPFVFFAQAPKKETIDLRDHQIDHYKNVGEILFGDKEDPSRSPNLCYFDVSSMGRGKTYVAGKLVLETGFSYMVVCPNSEPWDTMNRTIDMKGKYLGSMTYNGLSGTVRAAKPPNPPYPVYKTECAFVKYNGMDYALLTRTDTIQVLVDPSGRRSYATEGKGKTLKYKKDTTFEVTPFFKWLVHLTNGFFIFLDEAHSLKNMDSLRSKACRVLLDYIRDRPGESLEAVPFQFQRPVPICRIGLLSATPMDKVEHAESLVRLLGMIKSDTLVESVGVATGEKNITGLGEFYNVCRSLDPEETTMTMNTFSDVLTARGATTKAGYEISLENITADVARELVYSLYVSVIHPRFASEMPDNVPKCNFRGFFNITNAEDVLKYQNAAIKLKDLADKVDAGTTGAGDALKAVKETLQESEAAISFDMVRAMVQMLAANPGKKGCIFVNYKNTIDYLERKLQQQGHPVYVITGDRVGKSDSSKKSDRLKHKTAFLKSPVVPGTGAPVLLMTVHTGAQSLNLQDLIGGMGIISFCSPGWSTIMIHQASGRSSRNGQLSMPHFYIFYPYLQASAIVARILELMTEKGKVIMSTRVVTKSNTSEMPGQYPRYYEGIGYVDEESCKDTLWEDTSSLIGADKRGIVTTAMNEGVKFTLPNHPPSLEIISGVGDVLENGKLITLLEEHIESCYNEVSGNPKREPLLNDKGQLNQNTRAMIREDINRIYSMSRILPVGIIEDILSGTDKQTLAGARGGQATVLNMANVPSVMPPQQGLPVSPGGLPQFTLPQGLPQQGLPVSPGGLPQFTLPQGPPQQGLPVSPGGLPMKWINPPTGY